MTVDALDALVGQMEDTIAGMVRRWLDLLLAPAKEGDGMSNEAAIELWFFVFYYGPYGNVDFHNDDMCGPHTDNSMLGWMWDALFGRHYTEDYQTHAAKFILRALFGLSGSDEGVFVRYGRHRNETYYNSDCQNIKLPDVEYDYGDLTDDPTGALFCLYRKLMHAYIVEWTNTLGGNLFNLLLQAFGVVGKIAVPDDPDSSGGSPPDDPDDDRPEPNEPDKPDGKGGKDPEEAKPEEPGDDDSGSGSGAGGGDGGGGENEGILIQALEEAKPYVETGEKPTREEEEEQRPPAPPSDPEQSGGEPPDPTPVETVPIAESFIDFCANFAILI